MLKGGNRGAAEVRFEGEKAFFWEILKFFEKGASRFVVSLHL